MNYRRQHGLYPTVQQMTTILQSTVVKWDELKKLNKEELKIKIDSTTKQLIIRDESNGIENVDTSFIKSHYKIWHQSRYKVLMSINGPNQNFLSFCAILITETALTSSVVTPPMPMKTSCSSLSFIGIILICCELRIQVVSIYDANKCRICMTRRRAAASSILVVVPVNHVIK